MRLAKRIFIALIALILVIWIGAYLAVQIAFPPEKIKEVVGRQGSKALNRELSIGGASVGVFPDVKIALTDLRIANAPGFSPDPAIRLKELAFSVSVLSLLRFSPVINEIRLIGPEILYEVDARGRNNLEDLAGGGSESGAGAEDTGQVESPVAVALKSFMIQDGRVRYRNMQAGQEIVLNRIHQTASLELDQKLENINSQGTLEIREIQVSDRASGLKKGDIRIAVGHDVHLNLPGERLQIRTLKASFQDVAAKLEGEIAKFSSGPMWLDLRFDAPEIKLASVVKEIPAAIHPEIGNISAAGAARLKGWIKGHADSASQPDLFADFSLRDGALGHRSLGEGIRNLHIRATATRDTFDLQDFGFEMAENPANMTVLLTGLSEDFPMLDHLALNASLDLGRLVPLLDKLGVVADAPRAAGLIRLDLKAIGRLNPAEPAGLDAQGEVVLTDLRLEHSSLPAPLLASGRINLTDDRISEDLSVKVGESDVSVTGSVTDYLAMVMPEKAGGKTARIRAKVVSENLNLDELMEKRGKKEVKAGPPMRAFPSLPDLDAEVEVALGRTQFLNLAMTDFASTTALRGKTVKSDFRGRLYSGGLSSTMGFDLRDTTDAKVDLALKLDKVEANDFISRLNDKVPAGNRLTKTLARIDSVLYGKFTLDMDVATHGLPHTFADNLTGSIHALVGDGRIAETGLIAGLADALGKIHESLRFGALSFSEFSADLEADQGRLLVKHCRLDRTPVGEIRADGSIGFDNTLALTLASHLPPALSRTVTGAGSALVSQISKLNPALAAVEQVRLIPQDEKGRAVLYFQVGGTLASPSFNLDAARMAESAGGGAREQLADQAKRKAEELKARAEREKRKLEEQARKRAEAEKRELQRRAEEEKRKAEEQAKKKAKEVLKDFGL